MSQGAGCMDEGPAEDVAMAQCAVWVDGHGQNTWVAWQGQAVWMGGLVGMA